MKGKRFVDWIGYLFRSYHEEKGWERERPGFDPGQNVPPLWQQEVGSCVTFVRSLCGSVPLEDPAVASLSFVNFLKKEGNPYLRCLENYANKHKNKIINGMSPKPQEEKVGGRNGAPTGAAKTEANSSPIDKTEGDDGEEALAGCESATRVDHEEVKSNFVTGSGTKVDPQSRNQGRRFPPGDAEVCLARHDEKGGDPKEEVDNRFGLWPSGAKRKEARTSLSDDIVGAKRRRPRSIERG